MPDQPTQKHTVLITGSSGAVGTPVVRKLVERGHTVRGLNRKGTDGPEESIKGDIADPDTVNRAVEGCDTIIHLAAYPDPADFLEVLLKPNVVGLYNIMNAAKEQGVRKVILASTIQVISGLKKKEGVASTSDAAPTNHYALSKVWAEAMGEMYARCHDMSVIAARIGWLTRTVAEAKRLEDRGAYNAFFSHDDAARFFTAAVETELPLHAFHVLYAFSKPRTEPRVDMEPGRRIIGYEPQDVFPRGLDFKYPA